MTCTALPVSVCKHVSLLDVRRFTPVHEPRANHAIMVPDPTGDFVRLSDVRRALRAAGIDPARVGL